MSITQITQLSIKEQVVHLDSRLKTLANKMLSKPERLRVDAVYMIPFRNQSKVDPKKDIVVTPLHGSEAVRHAVYALTAIHIEPGAQHPRETLRAPGLIALPDDWFAEVKAINELKETLQDTVSQIKDQYQRMKAWGSIKYLSSLQTMRENMVIDGPATIRFYWDEAPSVKNKTAAEWIDHYTKHLNKLYGYVPQMNELLEGDSSRKYVAALSLLASQPTEERFAEFRPGHAHVRARITFIDKKKPIIRPISTPICYPKDDPVPPVTALTNWEAGKTTARSGARANIESETFFDGLYLHRYITPPKPKKTSAKS